MENPQAENPEKPNGVVPSPQPVTNAVLDPNEVSPLREDQIQNAVAFLSHPRVVGSPESTKRSFLERKGLTGAEIDEAFKRVPQTSNVPSVTAPSNSPPFASPIFNQGHQDVPPQALVPAASSVAVGPQPEPLRWTQVALGLGVLAAGVWAIKTYVTPHIYNFYENHWKERVRAKEEEREVRSLMLKALQSMEQSQQELKSSVQALADVTQQLSSEVQETKGTPRSYQQPATGSGPQLADLQREMREMRASMARMQGSVYLNEEPLQPPTYLGSRLARPSSGSAPNAQSPGTTHLGRPRDQEPHSSAFHEVMAMVSQGITPPNVRTDINDQPPDPTRPPTESRLPVRPKPWEGTARTWGDPQPLPASGFNMRSVEDSPHNPATNGFPPAPTDPRHAPGEVPLGSRSEEIIKTEAAEEVADVAGAPRVMNEPLEEVEKRVDGVAGSSSTWGTDEQVVSVTTTSTIAKATRGWRPPTPPQPTVLGLSPPVTEEDVLAGGSHTAVVE